MLVIHPAGTIASSGMQAAGTTEGALESIIRGTIELALSKRGFLTPGTAPALVEGGSFEFRLSVGYVLDMDRVVLEFSLSDARGLMATETGTFERSLDHRFDQVLGDYVEALMAPAEREVLSRPRTPPDAVTLTAESASATVFPFPEASMTASAPEVPKIPAFVPDLAHTRDPATVGEPVAALVPDAAAQAANVSAEPSVPVPGPSSTPRRANGLEAGLGSFVPIGRAAVYFRPAFQYQAGWDFPLGQAGRWRAAVAAALVPFPLADQDLASAGNVFMMISGKTVLRLATVGSMSPFVAVSAGPALAVLRGAGSAVYAKLMPFGSAGIGSELRIVGRYSLNLEVSSVVILDYGAGSMVSLWGLVPRFSVLMEL